MLPERNIEFERVQFTVEGLLWVTNENFNTEWIHFWDDLATFSGVKSSKDTLLSKGYCLYGVLDNLAKILLMKHDKAKPANFILVSGN